MLDALMVSSGLPWVGEEPRNQGLPGVSLELTTVSVVQNLVYNVS